MNYYVCCKYCGHKFFIKSAQQIFCSKKCKQKFHNELIKNKRQKITKQKKSCVICKQTFATFTKRKYCDKSRCRDLYYYKGRSIENVFLYKTNKNEKRRLMRQLEKLKLENEGLKNLLNRPSKKNDGFLPRGRCI